MAGLVSQYAFSEEYPKTESDFAVLPPYCKVKMLKTSEAEQKYWMQRLGPENYLHIHHYCAALHETNLALNSRTELDRKLHFDQTIKNYQYIEDNCQPTFVLMPEVLKNKGEAYLALGQPSKAFEAFQRALELKPDYTPVYAVMVDFYLAQRRPDKAKEILEKGLEVAPGSKLLQKRLKALN